MSCQYIATKLQGTGEVIIINGPPVSAVIDRVNGCLSVFKKYSGITVLSSNQNAGGSRTGGLDVATQLLTRFPKVNAIYAINDPTAIGVGLAAKQLGITSFFMTATDGSPDGISLLKDPKGLLLADSAQFPAKEAEKAVNIAFGIYDGTVKNPLDITLVPMELITRENVASYIGWK